MNYRMEPYNLDGRGAKPHRVYDLASLDAHDFWASVTDVDCPHDGCEGVIRWYEAGFVPGYRRCDTCGRHFLARGDAEHPRLILDSRYSPVAVNGGRA